MADSGPLKFGNTGRAVTFLAERIGEAASTSYDDKVYNAVMLWQRKYGLSADGIYGPKTNRAFTACRPEDLRIIAEIQLGIELRALKAVIQVEAAGVGFHDDGRPKILLERHYVYRLCTPEQRTKLPPELCDKKPGGYVGGVAEWDRFEEVANAVGEDIAIQSCSWGLAQMMGIHWKTIGLHNPKMFMTHVGVNEYAQLGQMGYFIIANPKMHQALKDKDWLTFAKAYNGPAQKGYDQKLADAYAAQKP